MYHKGRVLKIHRKGHAFRYDFVLLRGIPWWDDETFEKPNTLYLIELTINAYAQYIRDLFEDILAHYVGTPLLSYVGRKLVLDMRYVCTK